MENSTYSALFWAFTLLLLINNSPSNKDMKSPSDDFEVPNMSHWSNLAPQNEHVIWHENVSSMIVSTEFLYRMQIKFNLKTASILQIFIFMTPYPSRNMYMRGKIEGYSHFYVIIFPYHFTGKNQKEDGWWLFVPHCTLGLPTKNSSCPVLLPSG